MNILVNALFFLFIALVGIIGFFKGKKRGWQASLTKLIILISSALISVIASKTISKTVSNAIYTTLESEVFSNDIRELFTSIPSLPEMLQAIVSILLAPIIFYPVFLIVRIVFGFFKPLVMKLVVLVTDSIKKIEWKKIFSKNTSDKKVSEKNEKVDDTESAQIASEEPTPDNAEDAAALSEKDFTNQEEAPDNPLIDSPKNKIFRIGSLAGAMLGLACAIVASVIYLAPITGSLTIVGTIEDTVSESDISKTPQTAQILEIVDATTDNAGIKTINAIGGKALYNSLTSFKINKEKIKLDNEISFISTTASAVLTISNEAIENSVKAASLRQIVPAFERSTLLPVLMSEFLSNAASSWESGEAYFGIEAPSVDNEQLAGITAELYSLFKDSTKDTIAKDVSTIVNILAISIENGITDLPDDDPLAILKNKELTSKLLFEFINNSHLNPLIKSFTSMGISMICEVIGVPKNYDGLYEEMTDAVAKIDNSVTVEEFSDSIYEIFHNYGIDITDDSSKELANLLKNDNNYLLSSDKKVYIQNLLSATNITIIDKESQSTNVLLTESEFEKYSVTVTFETLDSALAESVITDAKKESDALADVFASVSDFTATSESEDDVIEVIRTIGKLLDKLASTNTIGKACVDNLIIALMQSNITEEIIAMNKTEAAKFAMSIIAAAKDTGYESIMNSIANTVETLSSARENASADSLSSVLENLTPETASALKHLITPELMQNIGVEGEQAEAMADVLSSVFDGIATQKETITEEEYNAEIKIVSDILDVTMSMANGSSSSDSIFKENAEDGKTVDGFVNDVMNSKIISDTIVDTVYGNSDTPQKDPLGANVELTESEETLLLDSLNQKLIEAGDDEKEETEKKVTAIAAFVNVDIVIVDGVAVIAPGNAS